MNMQILSLHIWLPILSGLILLAFPNSVEKGSKVFATLVSLFVFGLSTGMTIKFQSAESAFQYKQTIPWIQSMGVSYSVGIDGLSIWMVVLTSFLSLVAIIISNPASRQKSFFSLLLILQGTLLGVFTALDLALFYLFFEISLVPVALLTLFWGSGKNAKAATKYLAMLVSGSLLMLVAILVIGFQMKNATGAMSFNFEEIKAVAESGKLWAGAPFLQAFAFIGFLVAFLFKSPAVPFHGWITEIYESSPLGAIVGGVALKVGTYGLLRFCLTLFPDALANYGAIVAIIGAVGVIYGGILAITQTNVHRLLAFSTVSHVGFIIVGAFSFNHNGLMGASFQQFNHGIASAAVFVLLSFYYKRGGTADLNTMGGLKARMPVFSTLFLIAMLCNLGLPLTSGFIGEFLAMMGSFQSGFSGIMGIKVWIAALAGIGAILSAAYMLYMFQRMFYGESKDQQQLKDVDLTELSLGGVFSILILGLGIYPTVILKPMEASIQPLTKSVGVTQAENSARAGGMP
jgi:NADH-quinone oxidoreductase subunit M